MWFIDNTWFIDKNQTDCTPSRCLHHWAMSATFFDQ